MAKRNKIKPKAQDKARNWGCVTLQFKSGAGAHNDKSRYSRKRKHRNRDAF